MSNRVYVFCHGLNGCGQYDEKYRKKPYWGGASGDVVAEWRDQGLAAYAASVSPQGSAWDRACELYAQIAGVRTDYGRVHSEKNRHARFGGDFTGDALIPSWDENTELVLIGHSFGGATIRLFAELLAHGSEQERAGADVDDLSPLFVGGMSDRVFAIVTLAAPTNGTTAYEIGADPNFDAKRVKVSLRHRFFDRILKRSTKIKADDRATSDWANYDMRVDNARELNERMPMLDHVYYLSVACDATKPGEGGARVVDTARMDPLFVKTATLMGCYNGITNEGIKMGDDWHANDGLVNTLSARAPFGAPSKPFDRNNIERGVWNVMGDLHADHGYFSGGFVKKCDPHPFFRDLKELLEGLE